MVRRSAGSRATVALDVSEASERRDPRCRSRVNATGLVVAGCTRHSSVPGLAQPGARGPDERTGTRERKLALARNPAHAVRQRLSLVGQFDESLKPFQIGSASGYGGRIMKATQLLSNLGQSLWLDNITRDLLDTGTLKRYIDEFSVTGLTSNPTIFDHAIKNSSAYDAVIRKKLGEGKSGEELFFELALEDLTRAADLFRPIYDRTDGVDGWVSLEVSPLLAYDTASTLVAAKALFARAKRPNVLIKIPGTREGLPAIEEAIFAGVPVNVTLLFSREHYLAAAEAFLRGIERRIAVGLNPNVGSVASVFISRWDAAVMDTAPDALRDQLGIAIAKRTYASYRARLSSLRWQRVYNAGARPQRLLWASTGTKDPRASDVLYITALAAPFTVNTMPEGTLNALADHGDLGGALPAAGGGREGVLGRFPRAGIGLDAR